MIRSLSRREKMSQPRSPRWVCSMTVGMMKLLMTGGFGAGSLRDMVLFPRELGSGVPGRLFRFGSGFVGSDDETSPRFPRSNDETFRICVGDLSLPEQHIK